MKKYLMTVAAAVVFGAAFTSCSHDDNLYNPDPTPDPEVQKYTEELIQSEYAAVFEQVFGKVGANVDWGFGSAKAGTRGTRAQNANANEWADVSNSTGFGGWNVPDALTEGQKERVKAYFQANPNLTFQDPHWENFFVQQVYKGGSSVGANSSETITAADGSVYNSDNMNLMTVGQGNVHINNFNKGDATERDDVLDNGANLATHTGETYHKDKIMLMVDIDDTSCFGYHETGSSTHHNNKAALVSAATIDAWAATHGNPGEAVSDKWERSFLGFDLAIKEGAQAYVTDDAGNIQYASYDQAPEATAYAWDGEKVFPIKELSYIEHEYWTDTKVGDYLDAYKTIQNIGYLTTNKNFYVAADKVTLNQTYQNGEIQASSLTSVVNAVVIKDLVYDGTKYQAVINLPKINKLVSDGYLPVKDKNLTEWVQVGKSDGYFTDWIVTLTKAERIKPETATYRVIAEDLSATEGSDFDFNDVVFDVEPNTDGNAASIVLQAAGGIYRLEVNGKEVHEAFGQTAKEDGTYPMINTGADVNGLSPVTIGTISGDFTSDASTRAEIAKITIEVWKPAKDGSVVKCTLGAKTGEPACKILVDKDFPIIAERKNIANEQKKFTSYVRGEFKGDFWWKEDK